MRTIYQKAGCVLALYDEYSGRPLSRDICCIHHESGGHIIFKGNGIYVILGEVPTNEAIVIESEIYQSTKININNYDFPYFVWMMPKEDTRDRLMTTSIELSLKPDTDVEIILNEPTMPYRLLDEAEKKTDQLKIYCLPYDILAGRYFRIEENGKGEVVKISRKMFDDGNIYITELELKNSYTPENAKIYPVIKVRTDNMGKAFAVIRDVAVEGSSCIVKTGRKQQRFELKAKQMLKVTDMEAKEQ